MIHGLVRQKRARIKQDCKAPPVDMKPKMSPIEEEWKTICFHLNRNFHFEKFNFLESL